MIFDLMGGPEPEPRLTDAEKRQQAKRRLVELAKERTRLAQDVAYEATVFSRVRYQYYGCTSKMEEAAQVAGLDPSIVRAFLVADQQAEPVDLMTHSEAFKEHEERCQPSLIEALGRAAAEETD
jgi:hypothetical protein